MPKPQIVIKKSVKLKAKEQAQERRKQILDSINKRAGKGKQLTLEDINAKLDVILEILGEGK